MSKAIPFLSNLLAKLQFKNNSTEVMSFEAASLNTQMILENFIGIVLSQVSSHQNRAKVQTVRDSNTFL